MFQFVIDTVFSFLLEIIGTAKMNIILEIHISTAAPCETRRLHKYAIATAGLAVSLVCRTSLS